jgi:hypothetical protein
LLFLCWHHILYAHGPWFSKEYGSLGIWNTQGMENYHKKVRVAYHKSTQRGGVSTLSNPLVQMFQCFYRWILSRFPQEVDTTSEESIEKWIRDGKRKKHETWK